MKNNKIAGMLSRGIQILVIAAIYILIDLPGKPTFTISQVPLFSLEGVKAILSPASAGAAESGLDVCTAPSVECEEALAKLREIEKNKPKLPQPKPIALDPKTTALLILDLTNRCNDADQVCRQIAPGVKVFLGKARAANLLTVYTLIFREKDIPHGQVWDNFGRLPEEPVLAPDAFDKFVGGELRSILEKRGIKTVIITGASSNAAVLYTATTAASMYKYNVVIPQDGIIAKNSYIDEYSLYQFTQIPNNVSERFSITTLGGITFK